VVRDALGSRLSKRGEIRSGDVEVKRFSVEVDGPTFGLVDSTNHDPDRDEEERIERVTLEPTDLMFFEPWEGESDSMAVSGRRAETMATIRYLQGDATQPPATGNRIIAHICNDQGGWGKGFVAALSKRWGEPEAAYRSWYRDRPGNDFGLGAIRLVPVEPDLWVANLVAQHGDRATSEGPPIRYEAVRTCLRKLAQEAAKLGASVHMPRIGCGLAGGSWEEIEPIISDELTSKDIEVTVYDFG
jgi:O-acetyl-ADP-ribose deacetylase (regulator of RNase III)